MTTPVSRPESALTSPSDRLGSGRLGSYSLMGAVVGAVPLPWLPASLSLRIRGALVSDIAARFGVSITPEARKILIARGAIEGGASGIIGSVVNFAATRVLAQLGPLTLLAPLRSALITFALGHLFARYLETERHEAAIRIDEAEAKQVRRAIDRALILVFTTPAKPERFDTTPPEELRDQFTQATDGALAFAASLPGWIVRRLEAGFDLALSET